MRFIKGDKIILIGDSITDAGRLSDPEQVGDGYYRLIRDYYLASFPELNLQFINKGVGGNRVTDLFDRWQDDVIALQPNWVSVMIGINDVWRQLDSPGIEQVYPNDFERIYTDILTKLKEQTDAKIILMEPTIIEENLASKGNHLLVDYVQIVNDLAVKFDALLVPTNKVFRQYVEGGYDNNLTTDHVHMNSIGNMLLAKTWIETVQN
ncbi:SGNH/GDSL hydrolase family protein [Aquibacillus kalidii]|uniref:SGNH/GDSL hydrolase family protein n=1 Tax=Aquibacillus kalidii TaxID=2762597 RepID=UPI002E2A4EF4|nr:SGNH/GDSL hydrolase family protein [Aquibacillus kalidii]